VTAGEKHEIGANILTDLWNSGMGVISTQVQKKFFVNVVKRRGSVKKRPFSWIFLIFLFQSL